MLCFIVKLKMISNKFITVFILFCLLVSFQAFSQVETAITDKRDGQVYRTKSINGTTWMLDNLNYHSQLSINADTTKNYAPRGRFYHLEELDSVCPQGWIVSTKEDWLTYFDFLIESTSDTTLTIQEDKRDEMIHVYYLGKLDPFMGINPLNLNHTGWIEGVEWSSEEIIPPPSANYWVLEPNRDEIQRTHAHVSMIGAQIHRHKHNTKPKQKKKLRRFMVRCVKCE